MAEESPLAEPDDDAELLRPSWHETPDESDADRRVAWLQAEYRPGTSVEPGRLLSGAALAGLLSPLSAPDATAAPWA